MATAGLRIEPSRNMLSQAIVETLNSMPEVQRRIFIEIHYGGRSVEDVSRRMGMPQSEVNQILQYCERRLYRALKIFRDGTSAEVTQEPPHPEVYARQRCCL